MKFIPPLEIASKIMTLIVEAEKELILVSPYVNINHWEKMKRSLQIALSKEVDLHFIIRENADNEINALKNLGIYPIKIKDLHAKVYINDKYAIVTSQNIIEYSDINSIDVGYVTETEDERLELVNYIDKYIGKIKENKKIENNVEDIIDFLKQKKVVIEENNNNSFERLKLNSLQVVELEKVLQKHYTDTKLVNAGSYIFSRILPFGEQMIAGYYTIKLRRNYLNTESNIKKLATLKFNTHYEYVSLIKDFHEKFYYFTFIPNTSNIIIEQLFNDYLIISDTIINNYTE